MYKETIEDLNDPLAVLITWSYGVREKVAAVLKPLCYFVGTWGTKDIPGDLRFYDAIEPAELREKVFRLAYGVQYELGLRTDNRLTEEQAEALVSEIAAQQRVQRTPSKRRDSARSRGSKSKVSSPAKSR